MRTNPFTTIYNSYEYVNALKLPLREFPFIVDVELTNQCNLRCKMCAQNVMTRERGYMAFDMYKKIVNECSKYSGAIRLIRFGEHLLHKELFDFIKYTKEYGVPIHMTTNGLLLSEEKSERLIELQLDSIIFSMQGANKAGYQIMRNNDKYDLLDKNIKQLADIRNKKNSEKPWIHISSTMTNESQKEIDDFVCYWEQYVDSVGYGKTNFAVFEDKPYKEELGELIKAESIVKEYRPCTEVYQKLSVNYNGDITACCGDYDGLLVLGNIEEMTLKEAWKSDKLNSIRELLKQMRMAELPLCKNCYHTYEKF